MASGDLLAVYEPKNNDFPSSLPATFDIRGDDHPVLDFVDATNNEAAVFPGVMPRHYAGGGVTVTPVWMASSATTGNIVLAASWERHEDDVTDLDADNFAASNQVTAGAPSASGEPSYDDITFTDGADMDSIAAGESYRLKIERLPEDASDTMVGDAELLRVEVRET